MSDPTCRDKECLSFVDNGDGTFSQQVTLATAGPGTGADTPVLQCLQDDTGATFFVTYLIDPTTGLPSAAPIYMDVTGAPYTPTGTITKPKNPLDTEVKLFCDAGNNDTKFLKVIVFDEEGAISNINDVDLLGAAYTAVGPVEICENEVPAECELTEVWVCDSSAAVAGVEELEWEASAVTPNPDIESHEVGAGFTLIDGCGQYYHENAADVTRTITTSTTTNINTGNFPDQHELNFYVKLDEPTPLAARLRGNSGGVIYMGSCYGKTKKIFEGTRPFGTSLPQVFPLGVYPAGIYRVRVLSQDPTDNGQAGLWADPQNDGTYAAIPAAQLFTTPPAVEKKKAWINKGTEEYFNLDGTQIVESATLEIKCEDPCAAFIDGLVSDEQKHCELTKIYVVDTSGDNGATEEYWEASATDPGNTDINTAFTGSDSCDVIAHPNAADTTTVITVDGAQTTDNPTPAVAHQSRVEGYFLVPKGGKELQLSQGGLAASALYLAPCGDKLKPVANLNGTGAVSAGYVPEGVYHFVTFLHDDGTNGNARVRWRNVGAAYENVPVANIFVEAPPVVAKSVWIEKGKSEAVDLESITYQFEDENVFTCDPCGNHLSQTIELLPLVADAGKDAATIISGEVLAIDAGGPTTATLTVPAAANGAILQIQLTDPIADQGNCVRYYIDGRTATANRGFLGGHKEFVYLGCAASNEATITDAVSELADFNIHFGQLTAGAEVEVVYYAF